MMPEKSLMATKGIDSYVKCKVRVLKEFKRKLCKYESNKFQFDNYAFSTIAQLTFIKYHN